MARRRARADGISLLDNPCPLRSMPQPIVKAHIARVENTTRKELRLEVSNFNEPGHRSFSCQFSQIYFCRLKLLLPSLLSAARKRWPEGGVAFAERLLDLSPGKVSVAFGTLFVDTPLKPNVMIDLENDPSLSSRSQPGEYVSPEVRAAYYLEDEAGRIELEVASIVDSFNLITGSCIAVKGYEDSNGKFVALDACYAGYSPMSTKVSECAGCNILFISGLSALKDDSLSADLLFEIIKGNIWSRDIPGIDAVVISGDFLRGHMQVETDKKTSSVVGGQTCELESLLHLDRQLAEVSSSIMTLVIPGPGDPTNCSLPQLPFKKGLLPKSSGNSSLNLLPNPARFCLEGIDILFDSGQALEDACKYCPNASKSTMADLFLQMRHIAPSAPDTLCIKLCTWRTLLICADCYPFDQDDPFVLRETPRCFVVGNQPELAIERRKVRCGDAEEEVLIIMLPCFAKSRTGIILDSNSLKCTQVQFN